MKAMVQLSVLMALFFGGCARQQQALPPAPVANTPITTEADAIAVVLADIQRRGGDPRREECSAKWMNESWYVTAWHIWYPKNKGSSRFVPGGFTTYIVSTNGEIVRTLRGK